MPNSPNHTIFTLSQVATSIQQTLAARYKSRFWIRAEINKLNYYPYSGHCYPSLVEKENDKVLAEMKAIIWSSDFTVLNKRFLTVLNEPLQDGIRILFLASISFHPVHGLSLQMHDIDPSYTLGQLAIEKTNTIRRLKDEGLFDSNRQLPFPLLPQRIAIISVETSKGYADFTLTLKNNQWQYVFFHMLFPSLLQGEKAIAGIIKQLEKIKQVKHHFDVVAIIRGGGGEVGLSCFDNLALTSAIAQFPLPVLTGIGHATNETVTEIVAYHNGVTPTGLANYLVEHFHRFSRPVQEASKKLGVITRDRIKQEQARLQLLAGNCRSFSHYFLIQARKELSVDIQALQTNTKQVLGTNATSLQHSLQRVNREALYHCRDASKQLTQASMQIKEGISNKLSSGKTGITGLYSDLLTNTPKLISNNREAIKQLGWRITVLDPVNVLKRGYTMTLVNGELLTSVKQVMPNDQLSTLTADGQVESNVQTITPKENKK